MKGIILAGGRGTRLAPLTNVISKQLLPVYDKPMIHYPLATLMLAGIRDIIVISTPDELERFEKLLGSGNALGINISYLVQPSPKGIAESFLIAENQIIGEKCALILGDNIFYGPGLGRQLVLNNELNGALIFATYSSNPNSYGVITFNDNNQILSIEEKPTNPTSNYVIPGLYFFDENVVKYASRLHPSNRGELEIVDLINLYLKESKLNAFKLNRGTSWFDAGTIESLFEVTNFVKVIQERNGTPLACLEEISWRNGWIGNSELKHLAENHPIYRNYLLSLIGN